MVRMQQESEEFRLHLFTRSEWVVGVLCDDNTPYHVVWCGIQVEFMDIFSFHGINSLEQLDWTLREGGCMEVVEEYRAKGKIRWVGFSTHAHADVIKATISSKKFDCMNIHYHVRDGS